MALNGNLTRKKTLSGTILRATGGGGASIIVDSTLSATSENPVQNKVVNAAIDFTSITAAAVSIGGTYRSFYGFHMLGDSETATPYLVPMVNENTGLVAPYVLPIATQSDKGAMSAADKTKLDGIDMSTKLNANQGTANAGKFLVVGSDGVVAPDTMSSQQIQTAVDDWMDDHASSIDGLSFTAKNALMACFQNVAWKNGDGQTYYDALYNALFNGVELTSISAVFTQGDNVIYDTDSLDTLKQYLVVTANYDDGTSASVSEYSLSGTLSFGTSTITVTYGDKTATFTVRVTSVFNATLESGNFNESAAVGTAFNNCKKATGARLRNAEPLAVQVGDRLVTSADNLPSGEVVSMYIAYFDANKQYTGVHSSAWEGNDFVISNNYPYVGVTLSSRPTIDALTSLTNVTLKRIREPSDGE